MIRCPQDRGMPAWAEYGRTRHFLSLCKILPCVNCRRKGCLVTMKQSPGTSFKQGWIQALRQQHQEATSSQLLKRLPSALAAPAVLPPGRGQPQRGQPGRPLGQPPLGQAGERARCSRRTPGFSPSLHTDPPGRLGQSPCPGLLPDLGSWALGLPTRQPTLPPLPSLPYSLARRV